MPVQANPEAPFYVARGNAWAIGTRRYGCAAGAIKKPSIIWRKSLRSSPSVPAGWVDIGSVRFEFKPDGTYSVRHDGEVSGGLYWGDDTDSPMRIYEVFDPAPGQGWITVFWEPGTTQTGRLENITIKDGRLHFELWSDWGERPPYGPVVYDLTQTG